MIIETYGPEETKELGEKIGRQARPGQIYTLTGDLGVGENGIYPGPCPRSWDKGTGQQSHVYHCADL